MSRTSKILSAFRSARAPKESRTTTVVTDIRTASVSGTGTVDLGVPIVTTRPIDGVSVSPTINYTLVDTPIGAGGFISNASQAATGERMVHSGDVIGPMIRDTADSKWRWLMTEASCLLADIEPIVNPISNNYGEDGGAAGLCIAPSDKNTLYWYRWSYLWKSTDGGATCRKASAQQFYTPANSGFQRNNNPLIDVHPTNASILLFGTHHYAADTSKSGAFYSVDGGATPVKISGIAAAADRFDRPGRTFASFDPGNPSYCYVHAHGTGLYRSTTGHTGTFTLVSGSPTVCNQMQILADGTVFIACGAFDGNPNTSDIYKLPRGTGTGSFLGTGLGSYAATCVAVNPANTAHIWAAQQDGGIAASFNGGASWEQFTGFQNKLSTGVGELPWLNTRIAVAGYYPAMLFFDKAVTNKLWMTHGLGIAHATVPATAGNNLQFLDYSKGNEEKIAEAFISIPGKSRPILGNWDYSIWPMDSLTEFTNTPVIPPLNSGGNGLAICKDLDYAEDDPNFVVAAMAQVGYSNAQSTDGGTTWTSIPGQNSSNFPNSGGMIACNRKANIIILDTNNAGGHYTLNGGTTWANIKLNGTTDTTHFANSADVRRRVLTADKTRPLTFALVYTVSSSSGAAGPTLGGLWLTQDGGATWTRKITGLIGSGLGGADTRQFWKAQLDYVPGFSGEMLYTTHDDFTGDILMWLKNDGATVERIGSTVTDVASFGFGPVAPGQTRPSVGFYGKVNGVAGGYISLDWFATEPVLIARFPMTNLAAPWTVGCDRNILGRVFFGSVGWRHTIGSA